MYCPRCKTELEKAEGRKMKCPQCGFTFYRNPKPATSVVIKKGNKVLLGKRRIDPCKGEWDLVGGFLEYDESPQQCVVRETKEETGLDVEVERFLGFFMDRYQDPRNEIEQSVLTLGFLASPKKASKPEPQDDVAELKWFDLTNLPSELAFANTGHYLQKIERLRD